jgi:lysophospholipase
MVQLSPLLLVAYLLAAGSAAPLEPRDAAIRDAPSKSYTPSRGVCPKALAVRRSNVQVRPFPSLFPPYHELMIRSQGFPLNNDEASYISKKSLTSVPAWSAYLKNVNLAGLNVSSFTAVHKNGLPSLPNVGFAVSGGGYRALLYGASVLSAFDSRNASSVKAGTGGIMQLAAYSAGLSGGSWMTGTWALNNFPTFESESSSPFHLFSPLYTVL